MQLQVFKIPKETKEFWGAEYLNPKGTLSLDSALLRLETYVRVHGLSCENGDAFKTDEVLKSILRTQRNIIPYAEIHEFLAGQSM
jgi:hypothetical protein